MLGQGLRRLRSHMPHASGSTPLCCWLVLQLLNLSPKRTPTKYEPLMCFWTNLGASVKEGNCPGRSLIFQCDYLTGSSIELRRSARGCHHGAPRVKGSPGNASPAPAASPIFMTPHWPHDWEINTYLQSTILHSNIQGIHAQDIQLL